MEGEDAWTERYARVQVTLYSLTSFVCGSSSLQHVLNIDFNYGSCNFKGNCDH
jgi:hypothetical protein